MNGVHVAARDRVSYYSIAKWKKQFCTSPISVYAPFAKNKARTAHTVCVVWFIYQCQQVSQARAMDPTVRVTGGNWYLTFDQWLANVSPLRNTLPRPTFFSYQVQDTIIAYSDAEVEPISISSVFILYLLDLVSKWVSWARRSGALLLINQFKCYSIT